MIAAALVLQAGAASTAPADIVRGHSEGWHGPTKAWHGSRWRTPAWRHGEGPLACDPARFDGDHYAMVRINDGMITSIHLLRTEDGEEVVTSHPYGTVRATVTEDTRTVCMRPERLEGFVDRIERRQRSALPRLGATAPGANATYNTGLLSFDGQAPGACYNFTTAQPADDVGSLTFSSEDAASSVAAQTPVSATASGGFGAFSASASFAYSDQWRSSANSGSAYFNISSIYTLNSTVDSSNPLTPQGQSAGDQFATLCGVEYMASVPAGMVATLAVAYGSSSQAAKSAIDAKFSASFDLDCLTGAVEVTSEETDSESYFNVRLSHSGGGAKSRRPPDH